MPIDQLDYYIRVYDHNLEADLCQRLLQSFHSLERFQRLNGRAVRAGLEDSAWTELNVSRMSDAAFLAMFQQKINAALTRYNADIGLTISIPNSNKISDLVMKRYRPNQQEQFQLHFDAVNHMANRYLVILWYLNDVDQGGETGFPQLNMKVAARTGRLLMFPPYWMYQHEGLAPISGEKYILSTYLLFDMPQAS